MSEELSLQDGPLCVGSQGLAFRGMATLTKLTYKISPLGLPTSAQHLMLGERSAIEPDPSLGLHCLFPKSFPTLLQGSATV